MQIQIIQLGTNDVTKHDGDREELMVNASNAIQNIEELFPNATVGVCFIPTRRGKGNAVSNNNNTANKTNMVVKMYCAKKISRLYVDQHGQHSRPTGDNLSRGYFQQQTKVGSTTVP